MKRWVSFELFARACRTLFDTKMRLSRGMLTVPAVFT